MEELSPMKNFIRRSKKKKATVVETSKSKKIQIHHKRSNSEQTKKVPNKAVTALNLITKGPSINKLFFKNDNISLKSESMPKANKKMVKKYKSYNIEKVKNEIIHNMSIKKFNPIQKGSNTNVNYMNMDCIEKVHDLRGEAKCFENNNMTNLKKSKKPNYIIKNCVSNDKLIPFNNSLNRNPIYDFYQPVSEKEITKKPLQKIQSVNQEKRQYKFSDFKVIKDEKEEENDDSYGNINPDDYREGNNIEFITNSSFSEENDASSSISSGDQKKISNNISIRNISKDKIIKEIKKQKSDKLSNLVNKSFKNTEPCKPQRHLSHNYFNSNNNSETEENYFKNDTKFFISPKINSKHPSNKSLKSDAKSDYFNNAIAYFNDSASINDINKNSFLGGIVNKSKIRKIESLATNSNNDYEGDLDDEYDMVDNQFNHFIDPNRLVNNLTINDSFSNIKSADISQNHANNTMSNDNLPYKNNNKNDNMDNIKSNYNYYLNENDNIVHFNNNNLAKIAINKNINNLNNINNSTMSPISNNGLELNNFMGNPNQSNIINIHNMNNFNNNNFIFGNGNAGINPNQINLNMGNSNNKKLRNTSLNNIMNNNNIPQNKMVPDSSLYLFNNNNNNNNNNLYNITTNNRMGDPNYSPNNFIINNNNQVLPFQLNQLIQQNKLINENNNEFINYDLNQNNNNYLLNNQNYFQKNINNINNSINSNINPNINNNMGNNMNNLNNNLNPNYYHVNKFYNTNNRADNNNKNINMNYLNYYKFQHKMSQEINNNLGNYFSENNQFRYSSETKKLRKNSFQNQNMMNQNMMTVSNPNVNANVNHPNYMNALQYNNYMNNLNNSLNFNNNANLQNNVYNLNNSNSMIPNNNINPNLSHSQNINLNSNIIPSPNNNMNLNNSYQIINGMQNINNIILNNNIINNTSRPNNNYSSNKQKKQNYNLLSNEELAKQAYILAKNQNGCRYLQKRIENNQKLVPTLFFPNVLGHIQELSNDQFGNYYIKIIIKYLPEDMIYKFISLIHPSIAKIGTNQYGTKVIQYLIDFLNTEKNLLFFIEKILPHLVVLINDLNGIHIVQRLIFIKSNYIQIVYDKIFDNIQFIAVTRDGSNFIKKLIEFLDEDNMTSLIKAINDNLAIIITNQHGNYIIQNIIMKENLYLKFVIIETITKNIVSFSNQKFSSNVVEKCFEVFEMKDKVLDELIKSNNFEQILLNEYGNYVIQKALMKSDQNKQQIMFKLLVPLVNKLQCLPFGQKLLSKLFIQYPRLSIYILNSGE